MGDHWWDWFLPIRYSPSWTRRHQQRGEENEAEEGSEMYEFGPLLVRVIREAGLAPPQSLEGLGAGVQTGREKNRRRTTIGSSGRGPAFQSVGKAWI